jgi:hypothetical protein
VGKVMSRRQSLEILTVTIEAFKAIRGTLSLGSVAFEAGPPSVAKEGPLSVPGGGYPKPSPRVSQFESPQLLHSRRTRQRLSVPMGHRFESPQLKSAQARTGAVFLGSFEVLMG